MMDVARALYQFWSGFGIPAYVEGYIPDNSVTDGTPVVPPYISYQLATPYWKNNQSLHATIWYRDTSYAAITAKVDAIANAIGEGLSIPLDGGFMVLYKDANFCQFQPFDDDNTVKMAYLSLQLNVYA